MKNQFFKMSVVTLLMLGVFAGSAWAKTHKHKNKPSQPETMECKGTVEVTKNKAGNIETVDVKTGGLFKQTYNITLDEKGKELGEKMPGKQVDVKGMLSEKAGAKWLTVTEYSEVPSKPEKKTDKK